MEKIQNIHQSVTIISLTQDLMYGSRGMPTDILKHVPIVNTLVNQIASNASQKDVREYLLEIVRCACFSTIRNNPMTSIQEKLSKFDAQQTNSC